MANGDSEKHKKSKILETLNESSKKMIDAVKARKLNKLKDIASDCKKKVDEIKKQSKK